MHIDGNIKLDSVTLQGNVLTAQFSFGNSADRIFKISYEYYGGYLGQNVDIEAWRELSRVTMAWHGVAEETIDVLQRGRF